MAQCKKRKPNLALIETTRCYDLKELATRLERTIPTIRLWIKQGLPILPGTSPRLIDGAELKAWLKARWTDRKKPCAIDELYCCKCCKPRAPYPESVRTEPSAVPSTTLVRGKCGICETPMQQIRKTADLPEIIATMKGKAQAISNLTGYRDTNANPPLWSGQGTFDFTQHQGGSDSVH